MKFIQQQMQLSIEDYSMGNTGKKSGEMLQQFMSFVPNAIRINSCMDYASGGGEISSGLYS